jgi:hypothetical protein
VTKTYIYAYTKLNKDAVLVCLHRPLANADNRQCRLTEGLSVDSLYHVYKRPQLGYPWRYPRFAAPYTACYSWWTGRVEVEDNGVRDGVEKRSCLACVHKLKECEIQIRSLIYEWIFKANSNNRFVILTILDILVVIAESRDDRMPRHCI